MTDGGAPLHFNCRIPELELRFSVKRDMQIRVDALREAAEIVRNLRPKSSCTCGNYLSFRNGVPGHVSGCPVGDYIEAADEIDGRAEELENKFGATVDYR